MGIVLDSSIPCKIRVVREATEIFPKYRPRVGSIHDAIYRNPRDNRTEFCVIDIRDKKIVLREGEFEIIEKG